MLWVGVLGPIALHIHGAPVPLGSPNQRALLSVLLARRGEHVPADTLIDVLWGATPPRTADPTLRSYISRLRRHLGPRLVTDGGGYTLRVGADELDAYRFTAQVASARRLSPPDAVVELGAALELWRGPAFGETADLGPVRARARSLEQARIGAREALCRALIDAGEANQAIIAAEALTSDNQLNEAGWALLIEALAAAGRVADGSTAYHRARAALSEEGLEPSDVLRKAQTALLRVPTGRAGGSVIASQARPLDALIGREQDLRALDALLDGAALITLVGPGGVGKTRLAIEVARLRGYRHARGWRLVELAALADPSAVAEAVLAAVGVTSESAPARQVLRRVGALDLLLVLDNCEHVIDEVADAVGSMLAAGSRLRLLTTSRERLGVPGEQVWPVRPLPTDGDDSPAYRLFRDRAEAVRPGSVTGNDTPAIGSVVRRLDGLPLAIEMAAAQVATLSPADLALRIEERLDRRVDPLAGGRLRGEPRHRTLRAVIEWSEALLTEVERAALADWAVFSGAVTAADAVAVLGVDQEVIDSLAARSLLSVDTSRARTRYRMLRTVRAVVVADVGSSVARRHAEYFAAVAAEADAGLRTPGELVAHERLIGVLDDLRAAHSWARAHDVDLAAALSGSLYLFAVSRLHDQILGWAARLSPLVNGLPALVAGVNASIAYRSVVAGDLPAARRRADDALAQAADDLVRIRALESLSDLALFEGQLDEALGHSEALARLADQQGDLHYGLLGHGNVIISLAYAGRSVEAEQRLAELAARYRPLELAPSDRGWLAYFHGEAMLERDPIAAAAALADAITLADSVGNRYLAGVARVSATSLQARSGGPDLAALRLFAGVLRHWLSLGSWSHLLTTLRNLVDVLGRVQADAAAAQLWGAVSLADLTPSYGNERRRLDLARDHLIGRIGSPGFDAEARKGAVRELESAARAALAALDELIRDR